MKYHITPVRITVIRKPTNIINAREVVGKREPSYTVGGNVTGTATMENSISSVQFRLSVVSDSL